MSDDRLIRIEEKIDAINEHLGRIDVTLAKQHDQLEYHIKRTNLLEEQVRPISEHVTFMKVLAKWLGVAALFAAIAKVFQK